MKVFTRWPDQQSSLAIAGDAADGIQRRAELLGRLEIYFRLLTADGTVQVAVSDIHRPIGGGGNGQRIFEIGGRKPNF